MVEVAQPAPPPSAGTPPAGGAATHSRDAARWAQLHREKLAARLGQSAASRPHAPPVELTPLPAWVAGSGQEGGPDARKPEAVPKSGTAAHEAWRQQQYARRFAQAEKDYLLPSQRAQAPAGPSSDEQELQKLAKKEKTGELSAPEKERLSNLRSNLEQERQAGLAREETQARSVLGRRFTGRFSRGQMFRISEHGRGLARHLAAVGQHSNGPYIFVLVLSVVNDVVDIFDVSLFFPLDQIFDVFMLTLMLGARLFVRQELRQQTSGWLEWAGNKIVVCLVEWLPVVGILPCWTISAAWVWRRAVVRHRRERYQAAEEASAARAEDDALAQEQEQAEADAYPQEEAGVA